MYFDICVIEAPPIESKVGILISLVTVITPHSFNQKSSPGTDVIVTSAGVGCPDTAGRRGGKKERIIYEQRLLLMHL